MSSTSTLTRRRTAVLTTYNTCGSPCTRAGLVVIATGGAWPWADDDRIWDNVTFARHRGADVEVIDEIDWRGIEHAGWSSTELIMLRAAADLADYTASLEQTASVGDLLRLDARQMLVIATAVDIGRDVDQSVDAGRSMIADAFDRVATAAVA